MIDLSNCKLVGLKDRGMVGLCNEINEGPSECFELGLLDSFLVFRACIHCQSIDSVYYSKTRKKVNNYLNSSKLLGNKKR